jgi:hypothetical protein
MQRGYKSFLNVKITDFFSHWSATAVVIKNLYCSRKVVFFTFFLFLAELWTNFIWKLFYFSRFNPTIVDYITCNASVVKYYNATGSLARFDLQKHVLLL